MDQNEAKLVAARAAVEELPTAGVIGLGSGSTAKLFVDEVGARVKAGFRYRGVPTSQTTRAQAQALGIPLLGDEEPWEIVMCVDGADEVDERLNLIKGGGGALTREKIVNDASRRNVIIVDESKLSPRLGTRWAVPIEVLTFAHAATAQHLAHFGNPVLRPGKRTDSGNVIYDLHCGPLDDPAALDRSLHAIPGVVETGLFVGRADVVLVARATGVERLAR
jgi:ribose 5-phosphate isomerase A